MANSSSMFVIVSQTDLVRLVDFVLTVLYNGFSIIFCDLFVYLLLLLTAFINKTALYAEMSTQGFLTGPFLTYILERPKSLAPPSKEFCPPPVKVP